MKYPWLVFIMALCGLSYVTFPSLSGSQSNDIEGPRFCPVDKPCFSYSWHQGKVLIVYISDADWQSFSQWMGYWYDQKIFGAIFIISYEGTSTSEWQAEIDRLGYKNVYIIKDFDSSPLGLYPMAQAPALYTLLGNQPPQGPFYRYSEV